MLSTDRSPVRALRLICDMENVARAGDRDGETAATKHAVRVNTSTHYVRNKRRRAFYSFGMLAIVMSYGSPLSSSLGLLLLSSSCVGTAHALTTEGVSDDRRGETSRSYRNRGRDVQFSRGGLRGTVGSMEHAAEMLNSPMLRAIEEENMATMLDGVLVQATVLTFPPGGDVLSSDISTEATDESFVAPHSSVRGSKRHNAQEEENKEHLPQHREQSAGIEAYDRDSTMKKSLHHARVPSEKSEILGALLPVSLPARGLQGSGRQPGNDSSSSGSDEETEVTDSDKAVTDSRHTLVLTICIVVGCGIVTLVVLCIVRKVMDLCMFRNDPTGSIRYSQEEGLAKTTIERLPQTKYKNPPAKGKAGKKVSQQDAHQQQVRGDGVLQAGVVSAGVTTAAAAPPNPEGSTALQPGMALGAVGSGKPEGEERDSTEDMCAICLVDYEAGDALRILPGCRHQFHKECIDPWLETKAVCAYCKATVEPNRSICDRMFGWVFDRLGIHPVPPSTIQFSSTRRTFTNREVQLMMEPALPPAYRPSDMDYVGSMVAPRPVSDGAATVGSRTEALGGPGGAGGTGGLRAASFGSSVTASVRTELAGIRSGTIGLRTESAGAAAVGQERQPQQGSIVVQPVSAPSFMVVPREFALSSGAEAVTAPVAATTTATAGGGSSGAARGGVVAARAADGDGVPVEAKPEEEKEESKGCEEKEESEASEEKSDDTAGLKGVADAVVVQAALIHGDSTSSGSIKELGIASGMLEGDRPSGGRNGLPVEGEVKVPEAEVEPGYTGDELENASGTNQLQDVPL